MLVYKIVNEAEKEIAFIVNYSMHVNAFNGGKAISADYSGVISKTLRDIYGEDVAVLFMPGACGDTNCYDYRFNYPLPGMADKRHLYVGRSLAGTILGMDAFYMFPQNTDIAAARTKLAIKERPYRPLDDKIDQTFGKYERTKFIWDLFAQEKEQWIKERGGRLDTYNVPVSVLTFGKDMAIVAGAGELFVELGLRLKKQSPFKYTMVWELADGHFGYIPTKGDFIKGGYETRKNAFTSPLDESAGDMIVDYWTEQLNNIRKVQS